MSAQLSRLLLEPGPDFKWMLSLGIGGILLPLGSYYRPWGPPTLLDGAAKVTVVGNLGLIALF